MIKSFKTINKTKILKAIHGKNDRLHREEQKIRMAKENDNILPVKINAIQKRVE